MAETVPSESPKIADLKRRLAADPSSRLFIDLAREYFDSGQLQSAADVCVRGLKKHPAYLSARVLLGRVYFDMGRVEDSREAMESALAQAPDNLVARRVIAEICAEQGDDEGALERYRALLAFSPGDADTKRRIAQLEAKLAAAAARPAVDQPATVEPARAPDIKSDHEPTIGYVVPQTGDDRNLDPSVLATPTLAEIYLQQGLKDKAAQVYREILKGDPGNSEATQRLSEIDPPVPAPPPPDPAEQGRLRKISLLNSWLETIRSAAPPRVVRGGGGGGRG